MSARHNSENDIWRKAQSIFLQVAVVRNYDALQAKDGVKIATKSKLQALKEKNHHDDGSSRIRDAQTGKASISKNAGACLL